MELLILLALNITATSNEITNLVSNPLSATMKLANPNLLLIYNQDLNNTIISHNKVVVSHTKAVILFSARLGTIT